MAATLYADDGSNPVHIRNMSSSGALVEGAPLPDVGIRIMLRRGQLQAAGHVAWRTVNRAGVRFDHAVCVPDWMSRPGSPGQSRVDAVVATARSEPALNGMPPAKSFPDSIETELLQLRSELGLLESGLIADVIVVATHPEIQTFDIALQRIDRVLKRQRGGG